MSTIDQNLPSFREMYRALLARDTSYDGIFYVGVRSTGIFCRPTCPARKPKQENVQFYATTRQALFDGFRPCKRCLPTQRNSTPPEWARSLLQAIEEQPNQRWTNRKVQSLGIEPSRLRRWFQAHYGMTFQDYHRARRLGIAMDSLKRGETISAAAFAAGYESESGFRDALKGLDNRSVSELRTATRAIVDRINTPLGSMIAGVIDGEIVLLEFADRRMLPTQFKRIEKRFGCTITPGPSSVIDRLEEMLERYFRGELKTFDLPLQIEGTPFQTLVWNALIQIPYGETISYEELASKIGRPTAIRAVGRANGDNRISILVPCHRVIGADGTLRGYGGGLWRKQFLIDLEKRGA